MNKKIVAIGIIGIFLIAGFATASAVVIKSEIRNTQIGTGQIICHVFDVNATPGQEPLGVDGVVLKLVNVEGTVHLEGATNKFGYYTFENLTLYDGYNITAYGAAEGYNDLTVEDIKISDEFPTVTVEFGLNKKARSRSFLNLILFELFEHLQIIAFLLNIITKM